MKKIKKQELLRRQSYRVSATKIKDDKPEWSKKKTKKVLESFVVDQIRPRLSVFRSNRHIYAQIIDDTKGHTLVSASSAEIKDQKGTKTEIAARVGELLARKAKATKIKEVVFDRGKRKYHGRVKTLAEQTKQQLRF